MIDEPTVTYLDGLGADGVYFLPLSGTPGPSIQSGTAHACLPLADQTAAPEHWASAWGRSLLRINFAQAAAASGPDWPSDHIAVQNGQSRSLPCPWPQTLYGMSILSKVRRSPRAKTGGSGRPAAVVDQRIVKSGNVGRNWLDRQHLDFTRIRDFGHFAQLCGHWATMHANWSQDAVRTLARAAGRCPDRQEATTRTCNPPPP